MLTTSKALFVSFTVLSGALLTGASPASADDDPVPASDGTPDADADTTPGTTAAPTPANELPRSQSDDDVQPEVASPGLPAGGIVRQAGVGGVIGYGRAGVLELGGGAGFTFASDYRQLAFSPTIGYFIADNFEASAILSISNIKAGESSATLWSALLEPSYHVPINRSLFGFLGVGFGASHVSGIGTGFALAPRVGGNFMVGRSGVLTPSISYQYTTIGTDMDAGESTVVALTSAVRFNLGFTAMW
jgi:hypothetical protein